MHNALFCYFIRLAYIHGLIGLCLCFIHDHSIENVMVLCILLKTDIC